MFVKQRRASKTWEKFCTLSVAVITLILPCMPLVATGKPVCYIRETLDNGKVVVQQTDCHGDPNQFCERFKSWKDASLPALLNSPCYDKEVNLTSPEASTQKTTAPGFFFSSDPPFHDKEEHLTPPEASTQQTTARAITCSTINLPTIISGSFDCPPNSDVSKGEACKFTCNDGFYPVSSDKAVCEYKGADEGGEWSGGNYICHKCKKWNEWGESEYKFIDTKIAWNAALQLCKADGAHLASIENKQINDYVHHIVSGCNNDWGTWIGLELVNGAWKWNDRTNAKYRNWSDGQPSANRRLKPKALIQTGSGTWNDNIVSTKRQVLCERSVLSKK